MSEEEARALISKLTRTEKEMLLQLLDSGTVSMEEAFYFAYHTMEKGTKPALQKQFGIS